MSERGDKIREVIEKTIPEQFEKSSRETMLLCEKKSSEMVREFLETLKKVMREAACKEKQSSKDKVQYLLFSCLHSSIYLQKYLIRIDLMGQGFYHDIPVATTYWDAGDIYFFFEKDIEEIRQKAREKIPRLRGYEVDDIRYAYAPYYHRLAKVFIREMLEEMLQGVDEPMEEGQGEKPVKILFGEYMGKADLLFSIGKERFDEIFQNFCR